jgi:polyferredoxin
LIWLRRGCQLVCLGGFIALLAASLNQLTLFIPENFFLRLDPLILIGTSLAMGGLAASYIPALIVLASGPFLGRAFCGYVCPMGTILDGGQFIVKAKRDKSALTKYSAWKYLLLTLIMLAALTGVSLVFIASPISLITRLFTIIFTPLATFLGERFLWAAQPIAEHFDWTGLIYLQIKPRYFATAAFMAAFFGTLLVLARISPRLWCRCLCPSGALFSLTAVQPLVRRRVSEACNECGKCKRSCPMNAIPERSPPDHAPGMPALRQMPKGMSRRGHFLHRPRAEPPRASLPLSAQPAAGGRGRGGGAGHRPPWRFRPGCRIKRPARGPAHQ